MMLWKCWTEYASKFGKFSSGHRTGKGLFSFQSQRKAMPFPVLWPLLKLKILYHRIFFATLFFNWRIIVLQNFVVFCQTWIRISHRYTYVPPLLNLSSISSPISPLRIVTEPLFEFSESQSKFPLAVYALSNITSKF